MPTQRRLQTDLFALTLVAIGMLVSLAVGFKEKPGRRAQVMQSPLALPTPTPTATPGWWDAPRFITPTMPALGKLPGLPSVGLDGGVNGGGVAAGQPVTFQTLSCPTVSVRIEQIVTGKPGWWSIQGSVEIANLWYWKGEISADGTHWTMLYRSESLVSHGTLINFLTRTVSPGSYQLRLMAVERSGNYPEPCVVRVQVGQ